MEFNPVVVDTSLPAANLPLNIRVFKPSDLPIIKPIFAAGLREPLPLARQLVYQTPYFYPVYASFGIGAVAFGRSLWNLVTSHSFAFQDLSFNWSLVQGLQKSTLIGLGCFALGCIAWRATLWKVDRMYDWYINASLEADLANIPEHYHLQPPNHKEGGGPPDLETWTTPTTAGFWVAEIDQEIVGFVGLDHPVNNAWHSYPPEVAELRRMSISSRHKRKGIARALLAHLESHARKHGIKEIALSTTSLQLGAIEMYKKVGFVEFKRTPLDFIEIHEFRKQL